MMNLLIGLLAGIFGGLVGIGGGVVMIPLMVGVQKLTQHQAHGTSLVALVFTGLSGAVTYFLNGSLDFLAGLLLAATATFTARFGARSAHALPEWKLKRAFGGFLLLVALLLIVKPYLGGTLANRLPDGTLRILFALLLIWTGVRNLKAGPKIEAACRNLYRSDHGNHLGQPGQGPGKASGSHYKSGRIPALICSLTLALARSAMAWK